MLPAQKMAMLAGAAKRIKELHDRDIYENSLAEFLIGAWPHFDPAEFVDNWHFHAVCEHLEAVLTGEIPRLLINVPPRTGKTSVVSIAFPAFAWAQNRPEHPLCGPKVSFFYASYAETLAREHSLKTRRLVESRWYRRHWGDRFKLLTDRNTALHFENDKGGYRMATSVDARAAGFGADILIADDPHLVKEAESELVRQGVVRWWTETMPSRLNDRRTGAMIVVMQRVHQEDLSGYIISQELGYEHLMLPLTFDEARVTYNYSKPRHATAIGFVDPREEGELLWPERIPATEVAKLQKELGPYGFAGQYEQRPAPRGGGIIRDEWWQPWNEETAARYKTTPDKYPVFDYVVASLDTAMTEKEENDPSALSIWGVCRESIDMVDRLGRVHAKPSGPKVFLMLCWQDRLQIHDLVRRVQGDCKTYKVDRLLIEDKAIGHSVSQELARLFNAADFGVSLVNPRSGFIKSPDKVARVQSVVHLFAEGLIMAPDKSWADDMIEQCGIFPRGTHDDLVDTMSQALLFLRRSNLLVRAEEHDAADAEETTFRSRSGALYPA